MKRMYTYKYRLYPDKEQVIYLSKLFGCCRLVYNYFLNEKQTQYKETKLSDNYNIQQSKLTGLDVIIWVQTNNVQSTGKHNTPRIKFQNNTGTKIQTSELIPISISDKPEILLKKNDLDKIKITKKQINEIKKWIVKNKSALLEYWEEKIATDTLFQKLKK